MTLRKAWLLLCLLLLAPAVQADPVTLSASATQANLTATNNLSNQLTTTLAANHTGASQQFFTAGPILPAPEPATLALFGTGLVGIATLVRYRIRRSAGDPDKK
ncbi:MAG TPA: PEP-CTERM sorting domain-containing protein [Candidatus Acidoferrales bacterium]|jgi:hypothetical protein|nr:PEP-CTERM sorting domain-containing protein [Candidatus Acidoferrales bacterium]